MSTAFKNFVSSKIFLLIYDEIDSTWFTFKAANLMILLIPFDQSTKKET